VSKGTACEEAKKIHHTAGFSRRDMLVTGTAVLTGAGLSSTALTTPAQAQKRIKSLIEKVVSSPEALARRTVHRRAVEAAIWAMPIVSFDAM
jgi:hypothetical protein